MEEKPKTEIKWYDPEGSTRTHGYRHTKSMDELGISYVGNISLCGNNRLMDDRELPMPFKEVRRIAKNEPFGTVCKMCLKSKFLV